jgi:pyruvate formate lyase activating enzyme
MCPGGSVKQDGERVLPIREECGGCGEFESACASGTGTTEARQLRVGDLVSEVLQDRNVFQQSGGGVTFSGGEPMLQADFLTSALDAFRSERIHTAVETTAYCPWEVLEGVEADLFLIDLKVMDPERHRAFTGGDNARILDNIVRMSGAGRNALIRMPLIKGVNDHSVNIQTMIEFLTSRTAYRAVHLIPFQPKYPSPRVNVGTPAMHPEINAPHEHAMSEVAREFQANGFTVSIGR